MASLPIFRRKDRSDPNGAQIGIIDIGSNSIRRVVYGGPARIPLILFNEKVMAGLGARLSVDGMLDPVATDRALAAVARFRRLAEHMAVDELRTVATAAVRDASNGPKFLARPRALGSEVELLSGEDEALKSAYGVIAAVPNACGVVGDLGGGSLELARIADGEVHERASFPLGVLRVAAIRKKGVRELERVVSAALTIAGWQKLGRNLPFYLVGGSWRSLARLDIALSECPLPIVHHHRMSPEVPARLVRTLADFDRKRLRSIEGLSAARIPMLADAAALLALLVERLGSSMLITSAYGLREGLLYQNLPHEVRSQDPLICATRAEGVIQGRFAEHGDLLDRWIAPLFENEAHEDARLRHASCLLADVSWRTHPDFWAERGMETALHGSWVGIDARGRAMMARALYTSFGGEGTIEMLSKLCSAEDELRATRWGLAMRLGQRLSGGVAFGLEASQLTLGANSLTLCLREQDHALYGEAVERRHKALAAAFGLRPELGSAA